MAYRKDGLWFADDGALLVDTPAKLYEVAKALGVRPDWHEPDEQEVNAYVEGTDLDNAMGPGGECGELAVTITREGRPVARLNLATLLSWACGCGVGPGTAQLSAEAITNIKISIRGHSNG